jgi:hypothetical protein
VSVNKQEALELVMQHGYQIWNACSKIVFIEETQTFDPWSYPAQAHNLHGFSMPKSVLTTWVHLQEDKCIVTKNQKALPRVRLRRSRLNLQCFDTNNHVQRVMLTIKDEPPAHHVVVGDLKCEHKGWTASNHEPIKPKLNHDPGIFCFYASKWQVIIFYE